MHTTFVWKIKFKSVFRVSCKAVVNIHQYDQSLN